MTSLLPKSLGERIISFLYVILAVIIIKLPFLEAFVITPLVTYIHRFSFTIAFGGDTKTIQPIIPIIPILLIKALLDYNKRYGIKNLIKEPLVIGLGILFVTDIIGVFVSDHLFTSISILGVRGLNYAIALTASIWFLLVRDMSKSSVSGKAAYSLIVKFLIFLSVFLIGNGLVSVTQFADCSFSGTGCHIWKDIDQAFPNKLLPVGHQKFSTKPIIIRAPGLLGDVNLNGLISLIGLFVLGATLFVSQITKERDFLTLNKKTTILFIVASISAVISYALTLSRSSALGFLVISVIYVLVFLNPLIKKLPNRKAVSGTIKRLLFASSGVILLVVIIWLGIGLFAKPVSLITQKLISYGVSALNPSQSSTHGHMLLFEDALEIGKDSPLIGHGLGTFKFQYVEKIDPTVTNADAHSAYAQLFAEQGILGLIVYVGFIIFVWVKSISFVIDTRKIMVSQLEKKSSKLSSFNSGTLNILAILTLVFPMISIFAITYYGFFLPMVWWWGMPFLGYKKSIE